MKSSKRIKTASAIIMQMALWSALSVGHAQAAPCPLIPGDTANMAQFDIGKLLENGKYPELEARLEKLHRKNLGSDGGDLLTARDIIVILNMASSGQGTPLNVVRMWSDARPDSFFSQWATGIAYANQAGYLLGGQPMSQIGRDQLKRVSELDDIAVQHLVKAIQLNPRSALPQAVLLGIAKVEGQAAGKNAEQWLEAATQADPKNLSARINAMNYLSPRWGGSFQLLEQMVQQAESALPAQDIHYLRYNIMMARASHEEVIAKNKQKAHELFKQAKDMCENSETAQAGVIRNYQ